MKEEMSRVAGILSAGLYSLVLSHCWYGMAEPPLKAEKNGHRNNGLHSKDGGKDEEEEGKQPETDKTIITVACSVLEAACLYHMSQVMPGRSEGPGRAWLEVTVLGSLLLVSSRLMHFSIDSTPVLAGNPSSGGLQLYHVGFDVTRISGALALMLAVEHALGTFSAPPVPAVQSS